MFVGRKEEKPILEGENEKIIEVKKKTMSVKRKMFWRRMFLTFFNLDDIRGICPTKKKKEENEARKYNSLPFA